MTVTEIGDIVRVEMPVSMGLTRAQMASSNLGPVAIQAAVHQIAKDLVVEMTKAYRELGAQC